jgi:hypothetical protein
MRGLKTFGLCLALALVVATPTMSWAQAEQRPIEDFLAVQRATSDWVDYTIWSDPANGYVMRFDAFGKLDEYFGLNVPPTFDGRVTVRPLADGQAHVSVLVHTRGALCYGRVPGTPSFTDNAFGYRPAAVLAGMPASLGDGLLRIEFTMPSPSSPLPAYFDLTAYGIPGYSLATLSTAINCDGVLHPPSGYKEGTPGKARTTQTGLLATGVPGGCPPEKDADCFPAERVEFWATERVK